MRIVYAVIMVVVVFFQSSRVEALSFQSSTVVAVFAKAALAGMQSSVRKGLQRGEVQSKFADCIQSLDESSFNSVFAAILDRNLNMDELQLAEDFFATSTGKKYIANFLMQFNMSSGEMSLASTPGLTESERKELSDFKRTGVGNKLFVNKVTDTGTARQDILFRNYELVESCRAKTEVNRQIPSRSVFISKDIFFATAAKGHDWWLQWGYERFGPRVDSESVERIRVRSEILKLIIEKEYKVKVPYEPLLSQRAEIRQVAAYARSGRALSNEKGSTWCGALMPNYLASIVAATTAIVAPEFTWQREDPEETKQNASSYLSYGLNVLEIYCNPLDNGRFMSVFKDFLNEYQQVILPAYRSEISDLEMAHAAKLAAKQEEERKAVERKRLDAERAAADAEERIRRQKEAEVAEAKRRQELEKNRIALAAAEQQRQAAIKAGTIAPQSVADFALKTGAISGWDLVKSPPVTPDGRFYSLTGKLIRQDGNVFLFEVNFISDVRYFGVMIKDQTYSESGFSLRYEKCARLVGTYELTSQYTTVIGTARVMPVLAAIAVGACR